MNPGPQLPGWLRGMIARRLAGSNPSGHAIARPIGIYKVDRIGDFVLATGAIHLLVERFGAENCRLIVSEAAAELAAAEFPLMSRWTAPEAANGVWREMRPLRARLQRTWGAEHFEGLVCLRHARSLYRDLSLTWISATAWHGLGERPSRRSLHLGNRPALAVAFPPAADSPWSRELLAHREVLAPLLGRPPTWEELRPRLTHVQPTRGAEVVLCPFGGERIRDYPTAGWVAACRAAFGRDDAEVRLVGPAGRRRELEDLAQALRDGGIRASVTTGLSLRAFIGVLAAARLILTVESAAAHIATALDKPAVVVIGGGHFGWFGPWGSASRQRWVQHPLDCFGCQWNCTRPTVECLRKVSPAAIATAITEVLPR